MGQQGEKTDEGQIDRDGAAALPGGGQRRIEQGGVDYQSFRIDDAFAAWGAAGRWLNHWVGQGASGCFEGRVFGPDGGSSEKTERVSGEPRLSQ
ncbi:MAG: hypothetical protein J6386_15335 [Candidatus Synoicihabitans palmerolidicus]|nr:hypothetical protein [Candidatus Synoicihabitans palmerolidicus]